MRRPSFSTILTGLFGLFILNSIWSIISIFRVPKCVEGENCFKSFLKGKPSLDLVVFVADSSKYGNIQQVLHIENFDYNTKFEKEGQLELSKTVRNNGTLAIYTVIVPSQYVKRGLSLQEYSSLPDSIYLKNSLTKYAIPASASFNLLKEDSETARSRSAKPVSHIRSRFAIIMCTEVFEVSHSSMPVELARFMQVNRQNQFLPIVYRDTMQMRMRDLVELPTNIEERHSKFTFIYNPVSVGKFRFVSQIDSALHQFIALGFTEKDLDEVKGIFADTNLYLLCATILIGSIHLLLDFLSFKNDVSFWRNQTSMAGLSTNGVIWRAFSQTVVFMYLMEEGTSLLVLVPSGVATLIEFWKVSKVLRRTLIWTGWFKFTTVASQSDEERATKKYDEECMKYLSYVLYPLVLGAAAYSLIYQPHKSWYSWTINSLVNGVYAFGFLFMLPQLFINYRLKSVAALPWRAFTYRAFNTFIDDIFAFIITMPTAHRVACFRDDIVFLIYLYQRWLYPVDKARTDDISGETAPEKAGKKEKKQ